jgi:hypothetical protein
MPVMHATWIDAGVIEVVTPASSSIASSRTRVTRTRRVALARSKGVALGGIEQSLDWILLSIPAGVVRHIGGMLRIFAMDPTGIRNEPRRCRPRKAIFTDLIRHQVRRTP